MNKVILSGRLTADPTVTYSTKQDGTSTAVARYRLAVERRGGKEAGADFINCVAFGKSGEFVEKYLHKGTKINVSGRIQTGSYTNKDGQRVYTTDVITEEHEFCEKRGETGDVPQESTGNENFMNIPEELEGELPFV